MKSELVPMAHLPNQYKIILANDLSFGAQDVSPSVIKEESC